MNSSIRRLSIVALICFFPLAIAGMIRAKTSPRMAIRLYYGSIIIGVVFLVCLSAYTYGRGGSFIKPMGTFY